MFKVVTVASHCLVLLTFLIIFLFKVRINADNILTVRKLGDALSESYSYRFNEAFNFVAINSTTKKLEMYKYDQKTKIIKKLEQSEWPITTIPYNTIVNNLTDYYYDIEKQVFLFNFTDVPKVSKSNGTITINTRVLVDFISLNSDVVNKPLDFDNEKRVYTLQNQQRNICSDFVDNDNLQNRNISLNMHSYKKFLNTTDSTIFNPIGDDSLDNTSHPFIYFDCSDVSMPLLKHCEFGKEYSVVSSMCKSIREPDENSDEEVGTMPEQTHTLTLNYIDESLKFMYNSKGVIHYGDNGHITFEKYCNNSHYNIFFNFENRIERLILMPHEYMDAIDFTCKPMPIDAKEDFPIGHLDGMPYEAIDLTFYGSITKSNESIIRQSIPDKLLERMERPDSPSFLIPSAIDSTSVYYYNTDKKVYELDKASDEYRVIVYDNDVFDMIFKITDPIIDFIDFGNLPISPFPLIYYSKDFQRCATVLCNTMLDFAIILPDEQSPQFDGTYYEMNNDFQVKPCWLGLYNNNPDNINRLKYYGTIDLYPDLQNKDYKYEFILRTNHSLVKKEE